MSETSPAADAPVPENITPSDGLPEEFVLTPELVEEEAIRGDVVLRWAAILLAFLIGCTTISQTATLVHVKSGEYLAANGILPDGTDPFAYTTEGRTWRNLGWLFDLAVAGVYGVAGAMGLTVFKAILAGVIFWLVVNLSLKNTPTWWNAIVAVLGAVACAPYFQATPQIITLLGCAGTLSLLHAWRFRAPQAFDWRLPILFLFWSNSDPRMFLGIVLLVLFAIGESLRRKENAESPRLGVKALWATLGACVVATLVNPFGWHALLAPVELYGTADPLFRTAYTGAMSLELLSRFDLSQAGWWSLLAPTLIAALIVAGLALVSLYLNYTGFQLGDLLLVAGFSGLAYLTGREIGPAVIVCCYVANRNCQAWYRESFRQDYTTRKSELLFSRGGRALTVLSFVAVAYLTMNGFVYRGYRDAVGFGFENLLDNTLRGLSADLTDQYDDRPFNFTYDQGDTLIWVDRKVFIDHRLSLFAGEGDDDLIALHDNTRWAMRLQPESDPRTRKPEVWKKTFDRFAITHALPRLAGIDPDYDTYTELMVGQQFQLTQLGPAVAVLYRRNEADEKLMAYLAAHPISFVDLAFRDKQTEVPPRTDFARMDKSLARHLRAERLNIPREVSLASHYLQHLQQSALGKYLIDPRTQIAFAYLALRNCHRALASEESPNNPHAYRVLGQTYYFLRIIEADLFAANGANYDGSIRYHQAVTALMQAAILEPDNINSYLLLRELLAENQRVDLALRVAREIERLSEATPGILSSNAARVNREYISSLEAHLKPVFEQIEKFEPPQPIQRMQLAEYLFLQRCFELALTELDAVRDLPEVQAGGELYLNVSFMRAVALFECGQLEEAYTLLMQLEGPLAEMGVVQARQFAAIASMVHGDFAGAASRWKSYGTGQRFYPLKSLLESGSLVADERASNDDPLDWSQLRYGNFATALRNYEEVQARGLWLQCICHLEGARNEEAAKLLREIVATAPESPVRPFYVFHLSALEAVDIDPLPPSDRIPVSAEMFAPSAAAGENESGN